MPLIIAIQRSGIHHVIRSLCDQSNGRTYIGAPGFYSSDHSWNKRFNKIEVWYGPIQSISQKLKILDTIQLDNVIIGAHENHLNYDIIQYHNRRKDKIIFLHRNLFDVFISWAISQHLFTTGYSIKESYFNIIPPYIKKCSIRITKNDYNQFNNICNRFEELKMKFDKIEVINYTDYLNFDSNSKRKYPYPKEDYFFNIAEIKREIECMID